MWVAQFAGFNALIAALAVGAGLVAGGGAVGPTLASVLASVLLAALGAWCLVDARAVARERLRAVHGEEFGLHWSALAASLWIAAVVATGFTIALLHTGPAGLSGGTPTWRDGVALTLAIGLNDLRAVLAPIRLQRCWRSATWRGH